jgi:hypothetical protein
MKAKMRTTIPAMLLSVVFTADLSAQVVARYDAGTGDGPPPVAPDQYSFNGQTWTASLNTNADVTVGPVSPDTPNCVNAWNVSDASTGSGLSATYSHPLDAAVRASASANGWEFTVVSRMVTNFSGTASAFIQFGDTNPQHRFLINIGYFSGGPMSMQLVGTNGGTFAFSGSTNYHTHKIVYSPATGTANYYVDWQLVRSGWTGDFSPGTIDGPAFGANSDSGKGSINFHRVEFGVEPPDPVAKAIHYIQVGPYAERTAIQWDAATNSGGPAISQYVVYRNGLEVQRSPSTSFVDVFLLPCTEYEFAVVAVDTNGAAYSPSLPFPVTSLPTVPATGVRRIKVLLYNFPDYPGEPFTTNDANDLVFSNAWSVNAYYQENSYGQLSLQGDSAGWYTMPDAASNYCTFTLNGGLWYGCDNFRLSQDALSVLPPDQTNNLASYDDFVMIFQGVGTVGIAAGIYKIFSATNGFDVGDIAHELGHGIDSRGAALLMHASGWDFCHTYPVGPNLLYPTNGCAINRYGDDFDVMGAANSYHFSMYHKEMLGFLQPTNIQVADHDGDYTLYAAEKHTNAVQMIKIPLDHEMFYFLEYRTPQGFDGPGTPQQGVAPIDGVLIRLRVVLPPGTDGDTLRPKIVLNPGTPFIDPYRGLRVEVTQKLGDHVVVNITGTANPLKVTDLKLTGAGNADVRITYASIPDAKYLIQSSTNLSSWVTEQTNILAGSLSTTNVIPTAGTAAKKFFRVGVDASP